MKSIKRMLLKVIFTQEERRTIANAMNYSVHRYFCKKNDKATRAAEIASKVNSLLVDEEIYTKAEVDEIVRRVQNETIDAAVASFALSIAKKAKAGEIRGIISRKKCEACPERDECNTYKMIFGEEESENQAQVVEVKDGNEKAETDSAEIPETSAENNG